MFKTITANELKVGDVIAWEDRRMIGSQSIYKCSRTVEVGRY